MPRTLRWESNVSESIPRPLTTVVRVLGAAVVALVLTVGSLMLVAALNSNHSAPKREHALLADRTVPVASAPPQVELHALPMDAAQQAQAPSPSATQPDVTPPPIAAPQLDGLAPTAGPGSLRLGGSSNLPSVSGLPDSRLEDAQRQPGPLTRARITRRVAPQYPALAQRRGIEGSVTVRMRIDVRGRVTDAVVVRSEPPGVFDRSALRAVRGYRFAPARQNDQAVESTLQQTIRFETQ